MISDYFILATRNIRNRGIRSWLTLLGVFIGIAAVVALISLGNGLQQAVTGQFSTLSPDKLIIQNANTGFGAPGSTAIKKLNDNDIKVIESVNGVLKVTPRLIRVIKFEYDGTISYEYIGDVPSDEENRAVVYESLNVDVAEGKLITEEDKGRVVLGSNFKEDRYGKEIRVGSKVFIQDKEFEVAGILKAGSSFQINSVIFMLDEDMKDILNIEGEYDMLVVTVFDKDKAEEIAKSIEEKLRRDRNEKLGEEDFSVQTPLQAIQGVNTILNIINLIVVSIAAISLIVGGVGITNTMYTSVLERNREIGVMKAIGAKNSDIRWIFLFESGLLGLVGGIVGAFIGLGMAFLASNIAGSLLGVDLFKVSISWPLIGLAIGFSFLIGIGSGLFPALQASKLKPVEALRR